MADGLLDPRTIRRLAAELDLRPTKQRGQNFVHDPNTVRRIVAAAGVREDDIVLEIGPGLGVMTAIVTVALVTTVVSSKYTGPILKSFGGAFADSLRAAQGN